MTAAAISDAINGRIPISKRCIFCKAHDQPLTGDGFRKRCSDQLACADRVRIAQGQPPLGVSSTSSESPALRPVNGGVGASTPIAPVKNGLTPAEAMIALLQCNANIDELTGPLELGMRDGTLLSLPIEALQARYVCFGKPGCGKTNTSSVVMENCLLSSVPVCALDYLGNLWGVRAKGEAHEGFPIVILGGEHGDLPLCMEDVELVAELVAKDGLSVILDLSMWDTENQRWFTARFFEALLPLQRRYRRPAMFIIEEAEIPCPSFTRSKSAFASQGAVTLWARTVRNWGIGWLFSTQRVKLVHSDIIEAASVFVPMLSTGDSAQQAIGKESASRVGKVIAQAIIAELGRLRRGETWLIPDNEWLGEGIDGAPIRMRIRPRWTYDSAAVPKIGEPIKETPEFVPVSIRPLKKLRDALKKRDMLPKSASAA